MLRYAPTDYSDTGVSLTIVPFSTDYNVEIQRSTDGETFATIVTLRGRSLDPNGTIYLDRVVATADPYYYRARMVRDGYTPSEWSEVTSAVAMPITDAMTGPVYIDLSDSFHGGKHLANFTRNATDDTAADAIVGNISNAGHLSVTMNDSLSRPVYTMFHKSTDDFDDVSDTASTHKKTTANEKTGGGRGYSALGADFSLTTAVSRSATIDGMPVYTTARSQQGVFLESFDAVPPGVSSTVNVSIVTGSGVTGGSVMRVGPNYRSWYGDNAAKIPFDPSKLYRCRVRVRVVTDEAGTPATSNMLFYAGVRPLKADGTANITGSRNINDYFVASGQRPVSASGWVEYTGYLKGIGPAVTNASNPLNPCGLPTGSAYMAPMMLINYSTPTLQVTDVDYFAIDVLDEEAARRTYTALSGSGDLNSVVKDSTGRTVTGLFHKTTDDFDDVDDTASTYKRTTANEKVGAQRSYTYVDGSGNYITTGRVSAASLTGSLQGTATSAVTASYSANAVSASYALSASAALNATTASFFNVSNATTGTLPDARLSTNIPRKDTANTFTALQTLSAGLTAGATASLAFVTASAVDVTGVVEGSDFVLQGEAGGSGDTTQFLTLDGGALNTGASLTVPETLTAKSGSFTARPVVGGTDVALVTDILTTATSASYALDSALLDGQDSTYFTNASNLASGVVPVARLTGSYAITASQAGNANTVNGQSGSYYLAATNLTGVLPIARLTGSYAITSSQAVNSTTLNGQSGSYYNAATNLTGVVPVARLTGSYSITASNAVSASFATNADLLDGQQGTYYNAATNLTGVIPVARLTGSYTITASYATNANTLDGIDSTGFATAAHTHTVYTLASSLASGSGAQYTVGVYDGGANASFGRTVNRHSSTYKKELAVEFKDRATIGMGGAGLYAGLVTLAAYSDASAGATHGQIAYVGDTLQWRSAAWSGSWGTWKTLPFLESANIFTAAQTISNDLTVSGTSSLQTVTAATVDVTGLVEGSDFVLQGEAGGSGDTTQFLTLDGGSLNSGASLTIPETLTAKSGSFTARPVVGGVPVALSTDVLTSSTSASYAVDSNLLDGQDGTYYTDAINLTGVVPVARLTGSYAITASHAVNTTTLNGQSGSYYLAATNLTGVLPVARLTGSYSITSSYASNANLLDGQDGTYYTAATNLTGVVPVARLTGSYAITASNAVSASYSATGLSASFATNADLLDGQQGTYYTAATNLTGVVPVARLTGSYAITASNAVSASTAVNANTATALQTGRTINGVTFDGTANISIAAGAGTLTGSVLAAGVVSSSLATVGTIGTGVWNATAIAAGKGGTGMTAFVANRPFYASTTTAMAQVAINATATPMYLKQVSSGVPVFGQVGFPDVSGTLADTQLTTNVPLKSAANTFSALNTFSAGLTAGATASLSFVTASTVDVTGLVEGNDFVLTGEGAGGGSSTQFLSLDGGSLNTGASLTVPETLTAKSGSFTARPVVGGTAVALMTDIPSSATSASYATNAGSASYALNATSASYAVTASYGATAGNAATATALQNARTINGTSFNGTANITVTAAAPTLTGGNLPAGVTGSSLTSVGTLGSLTVTGTVTSTGGSYGTAATSHTFTTPYGNIQLGPMNASYAHVYTNAPEFYFNKEIKILGVNVSKVGHVHSWADITSGIPTTVAGYGITDLKAATTRLSTDLNDATLRTHGFYATSAANTNKPAGATSGYGSLIVGHNSDVGLQIYGGYTNDGLWFRGYHSSGGTYTTWRTVLHDANVGTYALPIGGGSLTGTLDSTGLINTSNASGYQISGVSRLFNSTNYTYLQAGDAIAHIAMGNATDPGHYYTNTSHIFRNRSSVVQATFTDAGLTMAANRNITLAGGQVVYFRGTADAIYSSTAGVMRIVANGVAAADFNNTASTIYSTLTVNGSVTSTGNFITQNGKIDFGGNTRQMVDLYGTTYGIGVQDSTQYFRTGGGFAWYNSGTHSNTLWSSGGGSTLMQLDATSLRATNGLTAFAGSVGFSPWTDSTSYYMLSFNGNWSGASGVGIFGQPSNPHLYFQAAASGIFSFRVANVEKMTIASNGQVTAYDFVLS